MAIGDTITQPIPPVGTAGTTYASQLVAFLTEVKARLEAKVPLTSILVGALDMANNAFTNVQSVGLYEQATQPVTPVGSLQRYLNDLWYVSDAGAFQITDGAGLNASGVGGITGDYGSPNPAELRFVDADATYYFYDNFATSTWAHIRARDVEIAAGAVSALRIRLDWAGASSYTLTLPPSVPSAGNRSMLSLDENGDILQTGNVTHTITATHLYHTAVEEMAFNCSMWGMSTSTALVGGSNLAAGSTYQAVIPLPVGAIITSWSLVLNKTTSAANTVTARLFKTGSGGTTGIGTAQTNGANNPGSITLSQSGLAVATATTEQFYLSMTASAYSGGGAEIPTRFLVTYTHPA